MHCTSEMRRRDSARERSLHLLMKISGSIGKSGAARSVLLVAADPEGEEQVPSGRSSVARAMSVLMLYARFEIEGRPIKGTRARTS